MVNKRVRNAVLGCNLKNDRMISVRFQGKSFNITIIQVYAPTSNAEEAEVERFYEDLQCLLELTPKKDVIFVIQFSSVHFSSVAQSCPTLCDPMNSSTPGLPVHHQLPEFTQTHIHQVSDAIQPSHPLSSPYSPALNPSQHQSLFQRVNSSHEVAEVLEFQLQHHSFQRNPRADLLQNGLAGSPCSPRDSQKFSPTPHFKSINSSALTLLHSPTLASIHDHRKNHSLD